jgi:uncharacterized membrane protein
MKFNKRILIDVLILVIPVVIMLLLTPILPEKVPLQWNLSGGVNRFIERKYAFLLGVVPFVLYELFKFKYGRR